MRRVLARVLAVLVMSVGMLGVLGVGEAWADDKTSCEGRGGTWTETSVLGGSDGGVCSVGSGGTTEDGGVARILNLVVKVMIYAIGALGAVGIVIAGIQYLTAGGNEAQVTKAKNRLIQVVIGLVAYGLMTTLLNFLIPGGVF